VRLFGYLKRNLGGDIQLCYNVYNPSGDLRNSRNNFWNTSNITIYYNEIQLFRILLLVVFWWKMISWMLSRVVDGGL